MRTIGIDVSKAHLDVALLDQQAGFLDEVRIANEPSALIKLIRRWLKAERCRPDTIVCIEPTGHYSFSAIKALLEEGVPVWLAHPADIQSSIGLQRGKSDQVDARRIAQYALRFRDKAQLLDEHFLRLQELKDLLSLREQYVRQRAAIRVQQGDFLNAIQGRAKACFKRSARELTASLERAIKRVEKCIEEFVASVPELSAKRELAMTVTGVGPVLASELLTITRGFTRFDDHRQLVCYAGLAPYPYRSGTSVHGPTAVSHKANKRIKTLLHMAALNAIRLPGDLQNFYRRKREQGKPAMSALNAVRAKIIRHLWAVMESGQPYTPFKADLHMP